MNTQLQNSSTQITAPIWRRACAMVYDGLLLIAVLLVASSLPMIFTGGEALPSNNPFMGLYLISVCFLFFSWFWTHGGQTLGMRAWRIKITNHAAQDISRNISWIQAMGRFLSGLPAWSLIIFALILMYSPAGVNEWNTGLPASAWLTIGLLWLVIDHWPNGWREKITQTGVVVIAKKNKRKK